MTSPAMASPASNKRETRRRKPIPKTMLNERKYFFTKDPIPPWAFVSGTFQIVLSASFNCTKTPCRAEDQGGESEESREGALRWFLRGLDHGGNGFGSFFSDENLNLGDYLLLRVGKNQPGNRNGNEEQRSDGENGVIGQSRAESGRFIRHPF